MKICRRIQPLRFCGEERGKPLFCLAFLLFLPSVTFAADSFRKSGSQSSISMPSAPNMPSLSTPSLGSGFYAPGSKDFYYGIQNQNMKSSSESSSENADSSSHISDSNQKESSGGQENQTAKTEASQKPESLSKSLSAAGRAANSNLNLLTAGDLSAMNGLGLFSTLSGLLGNSSLNQDLSSNSQFLVNQNSRDSKKLEQILSELSELKSQNVSSGGTIKEAQNGFSSAEKHGPEILRFIVNGYDILSTCKKIYFSDQENDGTFLLTGDRKYLSENKARSETFYFFFHADGSSGGITKYKVTPAVSQDYENKHSFLYGLAQKSELEAQRTGNLITLRAGDGSWKMDLLISM